MPNIAVCTALEVLVIFLQSVDLQYGQVIVGNEGCDSGLGVIENSCV